MATRTHVTYHFFAILVPLLVLFLFAPISPLLALILFILLFPPIIIVHHE